MENGTLHSDPDVDIVANRPLTTKASQPLDPTLKRLEEHGLVEHRDRFWTIADGDHAVASAGTHGAATADDIDGDFSDDDVEAWMETAVDPIESATERDEES